MIVLVCSALVTPPDPGTMVLMAVPLWLLFEISIMAVKFIGSKDDSEKSSEEEPEPEPKEEFEGAEQQEEGAFLEDGDPEPEISSSEGPEALETEEPPKIETEE